MDPPKHQSSTNGKNNGSYIVGGDGANAQDVQEIGGNDQAYSPKEEESLSPVHAVSIQSGLGQQENGREIQGIGLGEMHPKPVPILFFQDINLACGVQGEV
jgi:hypothetical protein